MQRGSRQLIVLLAVAVAAVSIFLVATERWGLGVSYDSVVYVQASHSLSKIPLPQARDQGGKPLYWWAPGYPLVLKAFGGTYSGARLLNALLLFVGVLVVGAAAWKATDARSGVLAATLYAFSPAVFSAHLSLLAEPLFLVLGTAAVALIAARRPVPAGLAAGAATLTRFAGVPLIFAGAVLLRGRDRLTFLAISAGMYVGWLVRNELVVGELTGRELSWHPPAWTMVSNGLSAFARLLITPGRLTSIHLPFGDPGLPGLLAQVIAAVALAVCLLTGIRRDPPRLVTAGLVYAGIYCAFVLFTATFFDDLTPFDERLLVPIVPSLVFTVAWLARRRPLPALALCGVFIVMVLQQARTVSLYGIDYSGRIWSAARFSPTALPPGQLYATWPAAVAYFTGRSPRRMPNPYDEHDRSPNKSFDNELAQLGRAVRGGQATVVLFDDTFLEIPSGPPLSQVPTFRHECRAVTKVVFVCTHRRSS